VVPVVVNTSRLWRTHWEAVEARCHTAGDHKTLDYARTASHNLVPETAGILAARAALDLGMAVAGTAEGVVRLSIRYRTWVSGRGGGASGRRDTCW
jgi:hypothetical protein